MLMLISPAKNMKPKPLETKLHLPEFICEAESLHAVLKEYNDEDIMRIMKVNAKLAVENEERMKQIRFDDQGTAALCTYEGLQYKYMHLENWDLEDYRYADEHLRILSGFYGIVRPLDSIYPYRLEMQTRLLDERIDNLYTFWGCELMAHARRENSDSIFINLASKEYSDAVAPYVRDDELFITIQFRMWKDGRYRTLATDAKMARGAMVQYIVQNRIDNVDSLKQFQGMGYHYDPVHSSKSEFWFIK